jgi:heme oxygenase
MLIAVVSPVEVESHPGNPLWFLDDRGGPVRARLRQATADIHERLHRHPGFAALTARVLTVSAYAESAGCPYVLEGAGLGGAAMARGLDYLLGPERRSGRRFFLGRNDPDSVPWPGFCRRLEAMADHADTAEIIASARRTFEAMELWLSPRDDPGHDNV